MLRHLSLFWGNGLIGKDSDAGRDWGQEEKAMTEDEMAGWHHQLDGHESEWTPGVGDGQGGLACCDSWGHKESDTTEWLNWTQLNYGKDMSNRACCFATCNNQSKLSFHAHLDEYVKVLFCVSPDTPASLTGLDYTATYTSFSNWWQVQALFSIGQNQEEKTGSIKNGS